MNAIKGLLTTLILIATVNYMTSIVAQPSSQEDDIMHQYMATVLAKRPMGNVYRPTIDIAQYVIHEGNARSSNLIEAFIPIYPRAFQQLGFTDIRFYNPNGAPVEGNIDIGYRKLLHQNTRLFGIYGGYDRFRSDTRRYYSQLHAGFEYWIRRFFVGGNGYLPVGTKVYDNDAVNSASLVSTSVAYRYNISYAQGKERVLPGIDAEIGYDITPALTVYAGGYYFDHSDVSSVAGPKIRATYTLYRGSVHRLLGLFDRVRLEGLLSHDSARGTSWLFGLRLRFGLSRHPNPNYGIARHMTDTVRRDLNVISENFNAPSQGYRINGNLAKVDLVSNTSGRTIDDAVTGNADVIGIIGSQTASAELMIGDRDINITGGQYSFAVNGHPYSIASVGNNGRLTSAGGGADAFFLVDATGSHTTTLQHLTLNTPDATGFALETDGNTFGQITVDRVVSNDMPFDFILAAVNGTGAINFTHNVVNLQDSSAVDINVGDFSGVIFYTDDSSNQIAINRFSHNTINILNRSIAGNAISLLSGGTGIAQFSRGLSNNKINSSGNTGSGLGWQIDGDTVVSGNINQNTFTASNNAGTFGAAWLINDGNVITISGNVSQNTFTASDNTAGGGLGWRINATGTTIIQGNVRGNTFMVLNNASASDGWEISSTTTLNGNVSGNTFTATGSLNISTGIGWDINGGNTTIMGNVSGNTFTGSNNTQDGYGWNIVVDTTINGDVSGNTFTASNNGTDGLGWRMEDSPIIMISGNINDNTFIASNNQDLGVGWLVLADTSISGNVSGNTFRAMKNVNNGTGWEIASNTSIGGNISDNQFTTWGGQVSDSGYGWWINNNASILGNVRNNNFEIYDNLTENVGIIINQMDPAEIVTFTKTISGNTFLINGSLTGQYGFSLDTTDLGTITFNGNTQSNLRSLNNNASRFTIIGGGMINYNG